MPVAGALIFRTVAQLEALAKSAAAPALPPPTDRQRLQVGPIQPRLQLPRCDDVKAGIAPGREIRSRVLIELRCEGRTAWHLYRSGQNGRHLSGGCSPRMPSLPARC